MFDDTSTNVCISSDFKTASRPDHYGIDIVSTLGPGIIDGTYIESATTGKVEVRGVAHTIMGNYVTIQTNSINPSLSSLYLIKARYVHMKYAPLVSVGDIVGKETQLGQVGAVGLGVTGPHLHIAVITNGMISSVPEDGYVDPKVFFPTISFVYQE